MPSLFVFYELSDKEFYEKLNRRIVFLKNRGIVDEFHEEELSKVNDSDICEVLRNVDAVLLLVSRKFIDAGFFSSKEMQFLKECCKAGKVKVIEAVITDDIEVKSNASFQTEILPVERRKDVFISDPASAIDDIVEAIEKAMSYTWWEKTVEYSFILRLKSKFDFAAPFSGSEERAGDGVFANAEKLTLIEFKRGYSEKMSERTKFNDYEAACKELKERDGHHYIVYGKSPKKRDTTAPALNVFAETYFSEKEEGEIENIFDKGVEKEEFDKYLERFLEFEHADRRSSGSLGPSAYMSVVGVSNDKASTVSLEHYLTVGLGYEYQFNPKSGVKLVKGMRR